MDRLLSSILSKPVKLSRAAVSNDSEKITIEAMAIRLVLSGLLKTVVAMKLASAKERRVKASPVTVLNIMPAAIMSCMSSSLFAALYCAMYFVMAGPIPQSWNRFIVIDGISATVYNPYSSGNMSLARIIVPTAIIMVEDACPMKSWKLPVAEVLPISKALSMISHLFKTVVEFVDPVISIDQLEKAPTLCR